MTPSIPCKSLLLLFGLFSCSVTIASEALSLEQSVAIARTNDLWLVGNQHSQNAVESMSIAAGTLPDPKVSIGLLNIASDSFDFNQEAMSQFNINISQMFPRGDSLAIRKKQLQLIGEQFPHQRENRRGEVTVKVAKLWLDAYKAQQSIRLIEDNRPLFEQLADLAEASYTSTTGKTRQQDIVRAELELTRLDDRLTLLRQQHEAAILRLSEWLSDYQVDTDSASAVNSQPLMALFNLATELPDIAMSQEALFKTREAIEPQRLFQYFSAHPAVKILEQKIQAGGAEVELAEQKYKPQWGINMGYGIRGDAPSGADRSDLFSVGVNFDMPLFTENRQDKEVQSAISKTAALKTDKWLLIRQFIAAFESQRAQLIRLSERQELYQQRLLPQMREQAEATLTAYTNDDGDFADVVRSRITELNASIDALSIDVEQQKTIIQLNYFFMKNSDDIILNSQSTIRIQEIADEQ